MNLVGFEHAATTDADKATVAAAKARLENPLALFNLPPAAKCVVEAQGFAATDCSISVRLRDLSRMSTSTTRRKCAAVCCAG